MFNLNDFGYEIVQIEINNTCNMACTFCPLPIRNSTDMTMNQENVFKILDSLSKYKGIKFIAFHQFGEPLMNRHIWDYLDHCHSVGLESQLVTNGLLLTPKKINSFCAKIGVCKNTSL